MYVLNVITICVLARVVAWMFFLMKKGVSNWRLRLSQLIA